MAKRTIFSDDNNNELETYVNSDGKLLINVGQLKDQYYSGHITLEKEDVEELIKILEELKEELFHQ